MKAILEFDLNDPDDKMAHLRCIKSTDMAIVIWEFISNSRKKLENMEVTAESTIDIVYTEFTQLMEEQNILINELIN